MINAQQTDNETGNYTPGGLFDNLFDRFGNQYSFDGIKVPKLNNPSQMRGGLGGPTDETWASCQQGYFELWFEPGSGFVDTDSPEAAARRAVACQVAQDLSDFINSPLTGTGQTVKIWFRDITAFNLPLNQVLGLSSALYALPASDGAVTDNMVYTTIISGLDAYTTMVGGSTLLNGNGASFFHGVVSLNFIGPFNWHTGNDQAGAGTNDLNTVLLHEFTHALGFASLIGCEGVSKLPPAFNYFSRYDTFLYHQGINNLGNPAMMPLIESNGGGFVDYSFVGDLQWLAPASTNVATCNNQDNGNTWQDVTDCDNAVYYIDNIMDDIPVYTPPFFERPSSLSHFEDMCYPLNDAAQNNKYFVMSNADGPDGFNTKRFLQPEERQVLCDLGYSVNDQYGHAWNLSDKAYPPGCANAEGYCSVFGINDGIATDGTFIWTGSIDNPLNISAIGLNGILLNDINFPVGFGNLQVISGSGDFSNISIDGFDFTPTSNGMILLSYQPFCSEFIAGNITYIFIYVPDPNCIVDPCATYVVNGDFESGECGTLDFAAVNCWSSLYGSADYYTRSCILIPNYVVAEDTRNDITPADSYSGQGVGNDGFIGIRAGSGPNSEVTQSLLFYPLLPGVEYTISFWGKVSENFIDQPNTNFDLTVQFAALPSIVAQIANDAWNPPLNDFALMEKCGGPITVPMADANTLTNDWHYFQYNFIFDEDNSVLSGYNNLVIYVDMWNYPTPPNNGVQVFIDDVTLNQTANIPVLNLPTEQVCTSDPIFDLAPFGAPQGGAWSGNGVLTGTTIFDPALSGVGIHILTYNVEGQNNCPLQTQGQITVGPVVDPLENQYACLGETTILEIVEAIADPALSVIWLPGNEVGPTLSVSPTVTATYTAVITDAGGCSVSFDLMVTVVADCCDDSPIAIDGVASEIACPCYGDGDCQFGSDGNIEIVIDGGVGDLSVDWGFNCQWDWNNELLVDGLCPGEYIVTVTDELDCEATETFVIDSYPTQWVQQVYYYDPTCPPFNDGQFFIDMDTENDPNHPQLPLNLTLSGPVSSTIIGSLDGIFSANNLAPGEYEFECTDANGCTLSYTFILEAPFAYSWTVNNASCPLVSDGSITFAVDDPEVLVWTVVFECYDALGNPITLVGPTITNLPPDGCTLNILLSTQTANGIVNCTWTETVYVGVDFLNCCDAFPLDISVGVSQRTCEGECVGTATVFLPSPGTGSLDIVWQYNDTSIPAWITLPITDLTAVEELCQGFHTVTATDDFGCTDVASFFMGIYLTNVQAVITPPTCADGCNGAIAITPNSPIYLPLTYQWTALTAETSILPEEVNAQNLSNLCPGDYELVITNGQDCVRTFTYTVPASNEECCPNLIITTDDDPAFHYPGVFGGLVFTITNPGPGAITDYVIDYNLSPIFDESYIQFINYDDVITYVAPSTIDLPAGESVTITFYGFYDLIDLHTSGLSVASPLGSDCNTSVNAAITSNIFTGCPAHLTAINADCGSDDPFTTCLHFFTAFPSDADDYALFMDAVYVFDSGYLNFINATTTEGAITYSVASAGYNAPSGEPMMAITVHIDFDPADQFNMYWDINNFFCMNFELANIPPPTNYTSVNVASLTVEIFDTDSETSYSQWIWSDGSYIYFNDVPPGTCFPGVNMPNPQFSMMPEPPLVCNGFLELNALETEGLHVWDFGDGLQNSIHWGSTSVAHTYLTSGTYTITHTVTVDGWSSVETFVVQVFLDEATHPNGHLATSETWTNVNYQFLEDLVVPNGVVLNIHNSDLYFDNDTRILIQPGGRLNLYNCNLTDFACDDEDYWQGIDIAGQPYASQTTTNQGMLWVQDSHIEHAQIAIKNANREATILNSTNGGMFTAVYTTFENNMRSGEIKAYGGPLILGFGSTASKAYFYNCDFLLNDEYPFDNTYILNYQVLLQKVGGVRIQGCHFINTNSGLLANQNNFLRAIVAYSASYSVTRNCTGYPPYLQVDCNQRTSIIEGFQYGIYQSGGFKKYATNVDQSTLQNFRNVFMTNVRLARATRNTYKELPTGLFVDFDPLYVGFATEQYYGQYFDRCTGYWFEGNTFNYPTVADDNDYGAVFHRNGHALNRDYRNNYLHTTVGSHALNANRGTDPTSGLKMICNNYTDNRTDIGAYHTAGEITLYGEFGISQHQGVPPYGLQPGTSAGNHFLGTNLMGDLDLHNTEAWVNYYAHVSDNLIALAGNVDYTSANIDLKNCPSGFNDGHTVKLQIAATHDVNAVAVKTYLQGLIDGGNTEEVTEEIIYTDYTEALALYYQLMGLSPSLSEEAMVQAIQKEYDLPAPLLTLILSSNPSAAKSPEVQKTLDGRLLPLSIYQRDMINQGLSLLSLKEKKEAELSHQKGTADALVNEALILMAEDESVTTTQMLNTLLQRNTPEYLYMAAEFVYDLGDANQANNILGNIPALINDKTSVAHYNEYMAAWSIMLDVDATNAEALTASQEATLISISEGGYTQASGFALSLLLQYTNYEYAEPLSPAGGGQLRKAEMSVEKQMAESIDVFPNPAENFITVSISTLHTLGGSMIITDMNRKEIMQQQITTTSSPVVIDVTSLAAGTYFVQYQSEGVAHSSAKFDITK